MEKRSIVIPLRLNAGELKQLNRQAENAGLSREEFLRSLILGGPGPAPIMRICSGNWQGFATTQTSWQKWPTPVGLPTSRMLMRWSALPEGSGNW